VAASSSASSRTRPWPFVRRGYHAYQRYVMPPLVRLSSSNDTAVRLPQRVDQRRGPISRPSPAGSARPAGSTSSGATSRWAWSPCTGRASRSHPPSSAAPRRAASQPPAARVAVMVARRRTGRLGNVNPSHRSRDAAPRSLPTSA
jgi:hypothetical protein